MQKTFNALNKLAFRFKYNKSKIVVTTDMGLNEISEKNSNVLCIYHKNARYLFTANDIINIINTSLTNNYDFFSEPICVKNPYNNLPFTKSILYNIYLYINFNTNIRPELLTQFFYCNFNLSIFKKKHEYLLREYAISNYVYKSPSNTLLLDINLMISEFNNSCGKTQLQNRIVIDKDFPKDKLIRIMRPYLFIYFVANYSLLFYKKVEARIYLKQMLLRFNNFNPQFGRKKIKIQMETTKDFKKKIVGKIIEFDETHVAFKNLPKENASFLEDHLNYYEKVYYLDNEVIRINDEHENITQNELNEESSEDFEEESYDNDELDSIS